MEAARHSSWLLTLRSAARTALPLVAVAGILCSCGYVDCKTRRENFNRETRKDSSLGSIHFKESEESKPFYSMNVAKVRRGYALQAPLYSDDDGMAARLAFQRDKEFRTFSGLQISFKF